MFVRILLHQMEEEKLMTQEELEFRRRCPYDAFGDYLQEFLSESCDISECDIVRKQAIFEKILKPNIR